MKIIHKISITTLLIVWGFTLLSAQGLQKKVTLNWKGVRTIQGINYENVSALCADELSNNATKGYTPQYFEKFVLPSSAGGCDIIVTHTEWELVSDELTAVLSYPLQPDEVLTPQVETGAERGTKMAMLTLIPVIKNPDGGLMRLKSFRIDVVYLPYLSDNQDLKSVSFASHSVLSGGNWYKVKTDKTGIYKITYAELQTMGVDMSKVTPENIRIFGNGGGLLPEANNKFRYDDLKENAISIVTANPNVFAQGDYVLFYATSPDKIVYNKTLKKFEHIKNIYSDYTYYFLNFDGTGLRIEEEESSSLTPDYTSTTFVEGLFYENDILNFINSGKDWTGERMDANSRTFNLPEFTIPHLRAGKQSWIRYSVNAKATTTTDFSVAVNDNIISNPSCSSASNYNYATEKVELKSFYPEIEKVKISFRYNGAGTSVGWLDWVELNLSRDMIFTGGQMAFADPISVMEGRVTKFKLQSSNPDISIWDVTDPVNVKRIQYNHSGDTCVFASHTDSLRQFVALDNTFFHTTTFVEKVTNQDLHGIAAADMLIVTHADYLDQANRLANHHRNFDGMTVIVATNEQIFNEFSSGSPDIVAIRDFGRMLYTRPESNSKLKYLLLFGDGSFDFKDRVPQNTNRVLTFQTAESLNSVFSFACDDFFGMFDPNEGADAVGLIDIGIGRFPVSTPEQAKIAVDKSIYYATNGPESFGDWRNKLCFVADDGNQNTHFRQVEKQIFPLVESTAPIYNISKIYIDAYKQVSTPTGERCPDANTAITTNVENGVLVMNYTGHGGETGWAEEGILSIREIDAWTNFENMPVFMTATCEFSRYDDPVRMSAGEHVFLNPLGGGVALFTTTRLANAGTNIGLTLYFYDTIFSKQNGEYPRFGDIIAFSKNQFTGGDALYIRNFVLLGDPALRLAYPKNDVVITHINNEEVGLELDTISAMEKVEIRGKVADANGNKMSDFNGMVNVKVFDKARTLTTLGSEKGDWPDKYTVQDNYIYQGTATVTNGDFTVSFIVPRDIGYSYGLGKISCYAYDDDTDANGYSKQLIIGGAGSSISDDAGPQISLFMDGPDFESGDITSEAPLLIAKLSDESGINTISNAIGHDIVATLDGDNASSIVLNGFYSADLDSYSSGEVRYKFPALSEGKHTLTLKAWDVFNNSSETTINFKVTSNIQIAITSMVVSPNPFSDEVKVGFEINLYDSPIEAHLEIFNLNGSLVATTDKQVLVSDGNSAGELTWNGTSLSGSKVLPGIYLITVRASNGKSETVKASKILKVN